MNAVLLYNAEEECNGYGYIHNFVVFDAESFYFTCCFQGGRKLGRLVTPHEGALQEFIAKFDDCPVGAKS